jgi:ubiquinone/menaquinone biosynthesis C-methylase UbiE
MFNQNKKYFLRNEGDKYYDRNKNDRPDYKKELLSKKISDCINNNKNKKNIRVLEIGCGNAQRLIYLKQKFPLVYFYGIDPSGEAIKKIRKNITLKKSTADKIPFKKNFFDIIVYGFCLYLVDDKSLFKVISEAERVSKSDSWIIVYDFYRKEVKYRQYKHNKKILIRKMDCSKFFSWCPYYKIKIFKKFKYKNKKKDFLSVICIKKKID